MSVNQKLQTLIIGRCIYCGTSEGRLTKEHIIPKLLHGNRTLLEASCDPCAEVTKRIEGYAGRKIFQDVRLKHGFKIKERPVHLPMFTDVSSSATRVPILVSTKNVPGLLLLINPEPAGILTGKEYGSPFNFEYFYRKISDGKEDNTNLPQFLFRELKINYLGRFIAKIALGFGVAFCGVDGFIPTICDIILKDEGDWHYWIGGTSIDMVELPPPSDNAILHRAVAFGKEIDGEIYLVIQFQLLSYFGAPIFTTVVGKLTEVGLRELGAL